MIMSIEQIKELCKKDEYLFSGSISFKESIYLFNFVNSEEMLYIVNEIKDNKEDRKIDIQTYAKNAKDIQQQHFEERKIFDI